MKNAWLQSLWGEPENELPSIKDDIPPCEIVLTDEERAGLPTIKCISLWQPWASLMAIGAKKNETRHWPIDYTGLFAIHAAQRLEKEWLEEDPFYGHLNRGVLGRKDVLPDEDRFPFGLQIKNNLPRMAIVSVGILARCVSTNKRVDTPMPDDDSDEFAFGNYQRNRFIWATRSMVALPKPIPYKGQQGIWTLEPETVSKIVKQITLPI